MRLIGALGGVEATFPLNKERCLLQLAKACGARNAVRTFDRARKFLAVALDPLEACTGLQACSCSITEQRNTYTGVQAAT